MRYLLVSNYILGVWQLLREMLTTTEALLGFAVLVAVMLIFGLVMLLAPATAIQLRNWIGHADRWSRVDPDWKQVARTSGVEVRGLLAISTKTPRT